MKDPEGRYRIPNPKCHHVRKGIVKAGEWTGAHVSHTVCDRPECIADAMEWAEAMVRLPAVHIPDPHKEHHAPSA